MNIEFSREEKVQFLQKHGYRLILFPCKMKIEGDVEQDTRVEMAFKSVMWETIKTIYWKEEAEAFSINNMFEMLIKNLLLKL